MKVSQARTQQEMLLQQYLRLKPSRAIDRLLSEHQLDRAYQLYQILQEKIKKNTSELRAALTEKYQNLVDCSNLLSTIKNFTDQIQQIQKDISLSMKSDSSDLQDTNKSKSKSVIQRVQQKVYKKKYSLAMRQSYPEEEIVQQHELMYLPFLRVQVLQSLESDLVTKKFTNVFISEVIDCLSQYIHNLTIDQQNQLTKNQRAQHGILSLIAEEIENRNSVQSVTQNDIIEIIFKCKLLSLNNSKTDSKHQDDHIFKFFYDIYQLILEKQNDSLQIQHLSAIFCRNIKQIQVHLSETFIKSSSDGTISFQYQIYEKLVKSNEFMDILDKLYQLIVKNYSETPTVPLKDNFLNLWHNFYISLLNLLFDKIDPLKLLTQAQSRQLQENIPAQMSKYFTDQEVLIENKLKTYQSELTIFFTNVNELFKKSQQLSTSSKADFSISENQIIKLYCQKLSQINQRIKAYCQTLTQNPSVEGLRAIITLFILAHEFNNQVKNYREKQYSYIEVITKYWMEWEEAVILKFHSVFHQNSKQSWGVSFDQFFMNYHTPFLHEQKGQIIQRVILVILQGIMSDIDSQRAHLFLQKIKKSNNSQTKKKQKKAQSQVKSLNQKQLPSSAFTKKKGEFYQM